MARKRTLRLARRRLQKGGTHPPEWVSKVITHPIFINVPKDTEARKQIETQLKNFAPEQMTFSPGNQSYIPGVDDPDHPSLGMAKNHMNALIKAKEEGWPNVLVVEDTAKWVQSVEAYPPLQSHLSKPYDVVVLNKEIPSLAYVVNRTYYDTFIIKLATTIADFVKGRTSEEPVLATSVFAPLQATDKWHSLDTPVMIPQ